MGRFSGVVRTLVILNAIVFAVGMLLPKWDGRIVQEFALWYPRNDQFQLWQLATYMFLHGGIGHIFFNMFALVSFGLLLERQWGTRRFLEFYFLCGIGAALVHLGVSWAEYQSLEARIIEAGVNPSAIETMLKTGIYQGPRTDPDLHAAMLQLYAIHARPMVGASGAIYGILVAFGLLYPNAKLALLFVPMPIAAKYFIPALLVLDLFSGVTGFSLFGGGIAHFAHLGGALIGFLLMWFWRNRTQRPVEVSWQPR